MNQKEREWLPQQRRIDLTFEAAGEHFVAPVPLTQAKMLRESAVRDLETGHGPADRALCDANDADLVEGAVEAKKGLSDFRGCRSRLSGTSRLSAW
jgi:hypothetical protein